MTDMKIKLKTI